MNLEEVNLYNKIKAEHEQNSLFSATLRAKKNTSIFLIDKNNNRKHLASSLECYYLILFLFPGRLRQHDVLLIRQVLFKTGELN